MCVKCMTYPQDNIVLVMRQRNYDTGDMEDYEVKSPAHLYEMVEYGYREIYIEGTDIPYPCYAKTFLNGHALCIAHANTERAETTIGASDDDSRSLTPLPVNTPPDLSSGAAEGA